MPIKPPEALAAEEMAERIQADLVTRGLRPGDRYLTSEQARKAFGVRKSLINQGMRILAERNVLVRQRRAGTFVGTGYEPGAAASPGDTVLKRVHVLMAMDYYRTRVVPAERFVDGITSIMPRATVQIHYVPEEAAVDHVRHVVEGIAGGGEEGVILIRSPREAQLFVQQSQVPAIVFGSVYPGIDLPSLDMDQALAARLGVQYAIRRGRQKFLLIMRDRWRQGDNLLLQGLTRELARSGVGLDSVEVASVPQQQQVIAEELRTRLRGADSLAVLCRGTFIARPAIEVAEEVGLKVGEDVDVIDLQGSLGERPCCPTVIPDWTYQEQIAALAKELLRAAEGKVSPHVIEVPVSLVDERGQQISEEGDA